MGALRKAQRALAKANADSDSEDESSSDEASENQHVPTSKGKEKEWSTKPRTDIAKRSNKHAYALLFYFID